MAEQDSDVDEWVFSIRVPAAAAPSEKTLLQLRQSQPPQPTSSAPSSLDRSQQIDSRSEDPDIERESLLQEDNEAYLDENGNKFGWIFSSPFWNVQSNFVLQVTYRPAWQAIPEFTRCQSCATKSPDSKPSLSFVKTLGSYCCAGGCGCRMISDRIDYFSHTWTTADISNAEFVESLDIPGVGLCRALKLTLTELPLPADFPSDIPGYLESAWESHLQNMESTAPTQHAQMVTVTFCLPMGQIDPPLLWKVQFPSLADNLDVAIETYSIFDGRIQTSPEPTHIYLNGFQSWSFSGSIVKGHEQPLPALPKAFSGAFNLGGSRPPPSNMVVSSATSSASESADINALFNLSAESRKGPAVAYQSDFFTCITADGQAPVRREPGVLQNLHLRGEMEEEKFPFQKLDETGGPAAIFGWLSQRRQFGIINIDSELRHITMHASADGAILPGSGRRNETISQQETDWAYLQLMSPHSYDEEVMVYYLHAVAGYNHARPLQNGSLLTGWCSWYHYYSDISESNLRENFEKLAAMRKRMPTNVAVVDDGYMTAWGDWDELKPGKFNSGMETVARDIESKGMRPGIWLAPFTADKHARITSHSQHPDWVIRNDFGAPANSANCGKWFYGIDATNPAARDHVHKAITRAVKTWGYNVLKIDFLYAACLQGNGKFDLSRTRAQAMHMALDTIRRAAGSNVFLIGCGCPIASAIGFVDGMRISADTGPTWYPAPPLPYWDHGTLPCLRSMIRNSISRAPLGHRWWHNDPDCLLLGESTRLTDIEVASAATVVAMTCGMMLLSDDLTKVSLARMRIVTKIFPLTGVSAVVLDLHSTNDGLPSLMRLWATDKDWEEHMEIRKNLDFSGDDRDHNREATFFARRASFRLDVAPPKPNERHRSCIHATQGLGTWTIVSLSNWSEQTTVLHVPPPALLSPPTSGFDVNEADTFLKGTHNKHSSHGYHVLQFWSSRYSWLPPEDEVGQDGPDQTLSRRLAAHETEIFHVKRVTADRAQYLGSDLHFSCCKEVSRFDAKSNHIEVDLHTDYNRVGHIFVFLPITDTTNVQVIVNGEAARWNIAGNTPKVSDGSPRLIGRVIRIMVVVHSGGDENGKVIIDF